MKRSIIYILAGILLLSVLLSGCSGSKKMSDGTYRASDAYALEEGAKANLGAYYIAIFKFEGKEVTATFNSYYENALGLQQLSRDETYEYTLKDGVLSFNNTLISASFEIVDENTIKYNKIKYVKD